MFDCLYGLYLSWISRHLYLYLLFVALFFIFLLTAERARARRPFGQRRSFSRYTHTRWPLYVRACRCKATFGRIGFLAWAGIYLAPTSRVAVSTRLSSSSGLSFPSWRPIHLLYSPSLSVGLCLLCDPIQRERVYKVHGNKSTSPTKCIHRNDFIWFYWKLHSSFRYTTRSVCTHGDPVCLRLM